MNNALGHSLLDDNALREWARDYELHFDLERERVKSIDAFQAWAETVLSDDVETERGWIPGWTLDDCTRKWVEHNGFDFPKPPIAWPAWASEKFEVQVDHDDYLIHLNGYLEADGDRSIKLRQTIWIHADASCATSTDVQLHGFEEDIVLTSNELGAAVSALTLAALTLEGIER